MSPTKAKPNAARTSTPRINRIFLALVLVLTAIPAWKLFATLPVQGVFIDQVIPAEAHPGDIVIVTGYALDVKHIEDLYLICEDGSLFRTEIISESGRDLRFRVPTKIWAGPVHIAIKPPRQPQLIDQMVYFRVLEPAG